MEWEEEKNGDYSLKKESGYSMAEGCGGYTGPFDEAIIFNKVHSDFVRHIEKIDERRYCSGGDDGLIVVWDVEDFKELFTLVGHNRPIACLLSIHQHNSSKKLLLSSSSDHQIIVWDVNAGMALNVFSERERMARCLTVLPDGNFLSGGEQLLMWNVEDGLVDVCAMQPSEGITYMEVMQNRYVLVAIDNSIIVSEIEQKGLKMAFKECPQLKLKPHKEVITSLCKIGETCFISGSLDGAIYQWAVDGWVLLHCYNNIDNYLGNKRLYPYSVQHVVVLQEKYIVAAHGDSLHVYTANTKRLLLVQKTAHRCKINHLCTLYDGHFLATCSEDSVINIWRIHAKSPSHNHHQDFNSIADNLSKPDITFSLIQSCSLHSSSVIKCLPVGDDKFLSSSADHRVILWMDGFAENLKRNETLKKSMPY